MRLFCVAVLLVVLSACPADPTGGGDDTASSSSGGVTSSSSSGASSGTSGHSGNGGPGGDRVELGELCRELRSGYRRAMLRTVNRCGALFEDADLERFDPLAFGTQEYETLSTAQSQLAAVSCDQFGNLRMYLDHVLQSVDRDRVIYDAAAAFKCREASTLPVLSRRDRPPFQAGFSLQGVETPEACAQVFHGVLDEREDCALTHECLPHLFCRPRADDTADGRCVAKVAIGETCDSRDECAAGGFCFNARCREPLRNGEVCIDERGYEIACGAGLACSSGMCTPFGAEGSLCSSGQPPCESGLVCTATATSALARCRRPVPEGIPCTINGECADCMRCAQGRCVPWLAFGAACVSDDECGPGQRCSSGGSCEMRPRDGETCRATDVPGGSQHGDCLYPDTFCSRAGASDAEGACRLPPDEAGDTCGDGPDETPQCGDLYSGLYCVAGECAGPAHLGEPCTVDGTTLPRCDHGFCKRAVSTDTEGICEGLPNIGEACGDRVDLASYCQTGFCMRPSASALGTCTAQPDIGEPCGTASHLSSSCVFGNCVMPASGSQGVCGYPLAAGAPCTDDLQCETGLCDPHLDRCITPGQSCQGCSRFEPIVFLLSLGMLHATVRRRKRVNKGREHGVDGMPPARGLL